MCLDTGFLHDDNFWTCHELHKRLKVVSTQSVKIFCMWVRESDLGILYAKKLPGQNMPYQKFSRTNPVQTDQRWSEQILFKQTENEANK